MRFLESTLFNVWRIPNLLLVINIYSAIPKRFCVCKYRSLGTRLFKFASAEAPSVNQKVAPEVKFERYCACNRD